jgi:hypothetical protein
MVYWEQRFFLHFFLGLMGLLYMNVGKTHGSILGCSTTEHVMVDGGTFYWVLAAFLV